MGYLLIVVFMVTTPPHITSTRVYEMSSLEGCHKLQEAANTLGDSSVKVDSAYCVKAE